MSLPAIHNQGPELRADSREVAKFFDVQHESLVRLINDNASAFEALGSLRFEIGVKAGGRGGERPKFCYLTEPQVAFLLTLTRNTGRTTELKLGLIKQFQQARAALRPVDNVLLSVPEQWRQVFPNDFYEALLALYGDEFNRSEGTPSWVGGWTNKYVYGPLWDGLSAELKAKRKARVEDGEADAEFLKLHQFLEANARDALRQHVLRVTTLLQAATSPEHFRELFASVFRGQTQLLFTKLIGKGKAA
jgi:hypothetical protein